MPDFLAYYITALRKDLNAYSDARLNSTALQTGCSIILFILVKIPDVPSARQPVF